VQETDLKSQPKRKWQDYASIKENVIELLEQNPEGMTGAKVAEEIGITQGAMSKYLSMLKVDGIITSRRVGVAKLWKLVVDADRAGMLADRIGEEEEATFKDYAVSLLEENSKLYEADGKRVLVMPTNILSNLYKYTKSILGTQVHAFFYQWGNDYVDEVSKFVEDVAAKTETDFIRSFLLLWKLKGWGKFEITTMEKDIIEVVWYDSIMSEIKDKNSVDDFISGALGAAASYTFGGNWRFVESECKASGAPHCRFRGNRLSEDLKIDLNNIQTNTTT
jgi:predicted hydrocarbon binding protein